MEKHKEISNKKNRQDSLSRFSLGSTTSERSVKFIVAYNAQPRQLITTSAMYGSPIMGVDDIFLTNFALLSRPVTGRPTKNVKQDEHDGVTLKVHIMNLCTDDKKFE